MPSSVIIPFEELKKAMSSICLITLHNNLKGSGCLIELPILSENRPMYGLLTNNHVINSKYLQSKKPFKISLNDKSYTIDINNNNFKFTSEFIDATFIQLTENELPDIKEFSFLERDEDENEEDNECQQIYILQYPKGEKLSCASGIINSLSGFNYFHSISTEEGSSGSPLINNELKVIGIHKANLQTKNKSINLATKFNTIEYGIRTLYNKLYLYKMEKARKPPKKLSNDEMNELLNHGLQKTELSNVFKCPYSKSKSVLLFYRTNHAWYCTSKTEKKIRYQREIVKTYKWILINSSQSLDEIINHFNHQHKHHKLEPRHEIIIMWLKLSELMYL